VSKLLRHATESMTNVVRTVLLATFILMCIVVLIGWLAGKDPSAMVGPMGVVVGGLGVGEASNVGKRFSFNPDAPADTVVKEGPDDLK
jgi:hypothetical protein